jgi:hypothetical protein
VKKTLYIVTTSPDRAGFSLLPSIPASLERSSVVLAQDGVKHRELSFSHVSVLSSDVMPEKSASPFPSISHKELLRLIFEADNVAVL